MKGKKQRAKRQEIVAALLGTALVSALGNVGQIAAQETQTLVRAEVATTAPIPVIGKIASLGVFKNGIAVVEERFEVPGAGRYATATPPSPLHGTFFIESDAVVETTSTVGEVEIPLAEATEIDWIKDFSGKKIRVVLPGESEPRQLRIVSTGRKDDGISIASSLVETKNTLLPLLLS